MIAGVVVVEEEEEAAVVVEVEMLGAIFVNQDGTSAD